MDKVNLAEKLRLNAFEVGNAKYEPPFRSECPREAPQVANRVVEVLQHVPQRYDVEALGRELDVRRAPDAYVADVYRSAGGTGAPVG